MSDNKTTKTIIMLRHDTKENWDNSELVLKTGEVGIDTTNNMLKVGDGINKYEDLPYLTTDNVLTLNTEQTITGQKTFKNLILTNREYEPYNDVGIRFSTDEVGYSGEILIDSDVGNPTSYGVHGISYNSKSIDFDSLLSLLDGNNSGLTVDNLVAGDGTITHICLGPDEATYNDLSATGMNVNYSFYGLETSTVYCNGFIQYFDRDGTSGEDIINADSKLLFPSQSGTLATEEWVSQNTVTLNTPQTITGSKLFKRQLTVGDPANPESSEDLYPKMQLKSPMGTITIGHEGTEVAPGIYVDNAGTKTRYDAMSIETMNGVLYFPESDGTFATQEFVESYVEDKLSNNSESSTDSSFIDGLVTITKDSTGTYGIVTVKGLANDIVIDSYSSAVNFCDSEGNTVYGRDYIKYSYNSDDVDISYHFPTDETGTHTLATRTWSENKFALLSDIVAENRRLRAELNGEVTIATFSITAANTAITLQNLTGMTEIDWGDGTIDSNLTHTYTNTGTYKCRIYGVTEIGANAFASVLTLTDIEIGNSVTSIGEQAFFNCKGLLDVNVPDSVTAIGSSAFWFYNDDRKNAEGVLTIPRSVTSFGGGYLGGFGKVVIKSYEITAPTNPVNLGYSGTKILVPQNTKDSYRTATNWSDCASQIYEDVQYAIETSEDGSILSITTI